MNRKQKRKLRWGLAAWAAVSLAIGLMVQAGWLSTWHLKFSNFLYRYEENRASGDIVIVAIDDKSLERRSVSELRTLRFSKADYAKVIENVEQAGAKVIGVDVILSEEAPAAEKATLAATLGRFDNVILAAEPKTDRSAGLRPLNEFIVPRSENIGSIFFEPDRDNLIRRQAVNSSDAQVPNSFAVLIARRFLDLVASDSALSKNQLSLMSFPVRVDSRKFDPIRIPLDTEGRMQINYFGPPMSYPSLSFSDAIDNRFLDRATGKPIDLKGKIVLIGEIGTGLHDEQYVPTSAGHPMPGVEIHANTIQTILSGRFLVDQSRAGLVVVCLLVGLVAMPLFLNLGMLASFLIWVAAVMFYAVATWVAFSFGLVLNTVYPHLTLILLFGAAYMIRYLVESRHAKHTERAFSKYVSHHVVKKILEHPEHLKLGGEKKEMTVLFSDIAGFTTISEKSSPEQLVEQLNEYLDSMTGIILDSEGTLDKYIGDAIMAFWGAPLPQSDHAVRACLASLDYQARLKELQTQWKAAGRLPFSARIGLNTGPMVVGNMGSHRHFSYTVIGDAVNLASRLEGVNKVFDTNIIISESTYHEAREFVEVRELDLIIVKGKTKPIRIYELLAKKGELTENQKKRYHLFHEGLLEYRKQEWGKAVAIFKKVLDQDPHDGPSKTYIDRCEHLRYEKLPKDWDGSYTLKTK